MNTNQARKAQASKPQGPKPQGGSSAPPPPDPPPKVTSLRDLQGQADAEARANAEAKGKPRIRRGNRIDARNVQPRTPPRAGPGFGVGQEARFGSNVPPSPAEIRAQAAQAAKAAKPSLASKLVGYAKKIPSLAGRNLAAGAVAAHGTNTNAWNKFFGENDFTTAHGLGRAAVAYPGAVKDYWKESTVGVFDKFKGGPGSPVDNFRRGVHGLGASTTDELGRMTHQPPPGFVPADDQLNDITDRTQQRMLGRAPTHQQRLDERAARMAGEAYQPPLAGDVASGAPMGTPPTTPPAAPPAAPLTTPTANPGQSPLDYTRPVEGMPGVFKTDVAADGQGEYGRAIYADSPFGATRQGLDQAIGQYGETPRNTGGLSALRGPGGTMPAAQGLSALQGQGSSTPAPQALGGQNWESRLAEYMSGKEGTEGYRMFDRMFGAPSGTVTTPSGRKVTVMTAGGKLARDTIPNMIEQGMQNQISLAQIAADARKWEAEEGRNRENDRWTNADKASQIWKRGQDAASAASASGVESARENSKHVNDQYSKFITATKGMFGDDDAGRRQSTQVANLVGWTGSEGAAKYAPAVNDVLNMVNKNTGMRERFQGLFGSSPKARPAEPEVFIDLLTQLSAHPGGNTFEYVPPGGDPDKPIEMDIRNIGPGAMERIKALQANLTRDYDQFRAGSGR